MHTLSEQLHATNMVRLAKGVCVCVCMRACSGMLLVLWCSCAKVGYRGGCWNAVALPVQ